MSVPSADACGAFRLSSKKLLDSVVAAWDGSHSTAHPLRSYLEHGAGGIWLESWVAIPRRHRVRAGWLWSLHQSVASTGNRAHCFVCIFTGTTVFLLEAWCCHVGLGLFPRTRPFLREASVCPFTRSLSVRRTSIGPVRHHISGLTPLSVFAAQIRSTRPVGLSLCEGTLPSGCTRMCGTHDRPYWKTQPCLGSGYLCHYPQAFCLREANLQEDSRRKDALIDGWSRMGCRPQRGF